MEINQELVFCGNLFKVCNLNPLILRVVSGDRLSMYGLSEGQTLSFEELQTFSPTKVWFHHEQKLTFAGKPYEGGYLIYEETDGSLNLTHTVP